LPLPQGHFSLRPTFSDTAGAGMCGVIRVAGSDDDPVLIFSHLETRPNKQKFFGPFLQKRTA
jgi:hypothetical protein